MSGIRLFLGAPLEGPLQFAFNRADPSIISVFLNDDCLQKTISGDQAYIGKTLETVTGLKQLELTEAHLLSLLKRLLPDYPVGSLSLHLLTLNAT